MSRKYALNWSREVVIAFCEKYSRATRNLAAIAGIDVQQLHKSMIVALASEDQVHWLAFKAMIRALDNEDKRDYMHLPVKTRRKYLKYVKWFAEEKAIDALDHAEGDLTPFDPF